MTTEDIEKKLKELEEKVSLLSQRRVGQNDVIPAATKQSHLVAGEMAPGDIMYGDGTNNFVRLPVGTDGQVLTAQSDGSLAYATPANNTFDDSIILKQIATPASPASTYNKIYPKSDNKLYILTSAGTETSLLTN